MYNIYIYKGEPQRFQFVFRAQMNSPAETSFFLITWLETNIFTSVQNCISCVMLNGTRNLNIKTSFTSSLCKARVLTATTLLAQLWSLTLGL